MKRIVIFVIFALLGYTSISQTYTPIAGRFEYQWIKHDSGCAIPPDTLRSAPINSIATKGSTLYIKNSLGNWIAITGAGGSGVWGSISGTIGSQTDLINKFGTKYDTTVRKMDTLYAITDSTLGFYVNGQFRTFKIRGAVQNFNGRTGGIVLTLSDVTNALGYTPSNLPNVTNLLQVVNAGGAVSITTGLYSARPSFGTYGRFYVATDSTKMYFDNGTSWLTISGSGGGAGTVTSVISGYGLLPGTITNSGTLVVDTSTLSIYWIRRKDSASAYVTPLQLSLKQNQLNGTGFVKISGTTISYDNSTYQSIIVPSNTIKQYWNGYENFVSLNTDSITEGTTNKFFTNARTRSAISLTTIGTSGASTYDNTTGILNIPNYTSSGGSSGNADSIKNLPVDTTLNADGNVLTFDKVAKKMVLKPIPSDSAKIQHGPGQNMVYGKGDTLADKGLASTSPLLTISTRSDSVVIAGLDTNHTTGLVTWAGMTSQCQWPNETPIGFITGRNTWTAAQITNDYIPNGTITAGISGSKMTLSGGSGAFGDYLAIPAYGGPHGLGRWTFIDTFVITSTGSNTGHGIGTHAYNPGRIQDKILFFGTISSPTTISLHRSDFPSFGPYATGTGTVAWSTGDTIIESISYNMYDTSVVCSATNMKPGHGTSTINYTIANTGAMNNTNWFALYNVGGGQKELGFAITSQETKNPTLLVDGDSKDQGASGNSVTGSYLAQLRTIYQTTIYNGGQGDLVLDHVTSFNTVMRSNPQNLLLSGGRNDLAGGATVAQLLSAYDYMYRTASSTGIKVWIIMIPEPGSSVAAIKLRSMDSAFRILYPLNYISKVWDTLVVAGGTINPAYSASDSIHPNQTGQNLIKAAIVVTGKIQPCATRIFQLYNTDNTIRITGNSVQVDGDYLVAAFSKNDSMTTYLYHSGRTADILTKGTATGSVPTWEQTLTQQGSTPWTNPHVVTTGDNHFDFNTGTSYSTFNWIIPQGTDTYRFGYDSHYWYQVFSDTYFSKGGLGGSGYYFGDIASNGHSDPPFGFTHQTVNNDSIYAFAAMESFSNGNHGPLGGIRSNGWGTFNKLIIGPRGYALTTGGAGLQINDSVRITVVPNGTVGVDSALVWNSTYKTIHKAAPPADSTAADRIARRIAHDSANYDEGVYSPTISNSTNVSVSSLGFTNWARVKNGYTISGFVTITPTVIATITTFDIDMPNGTWGVSDASKIAGTGQGDGVALGATIKGNTSTGKAKFEFVSTGTSAVTIYFIFHGHYEAP